MTNRRLLTWLVPLCLLPCTAIGCTAPLAPTVPESRVVTVRATDVTLKEAPGNSAPSVGASFTYNGNVITTVVHVSGDLPVIETDVTGTDGATRWTRVRYRGHIGPTEGGVTLNTTGYVRNDLVSAPHLP